MPRIGGSTSYNPIQSYDTSSSGTKSSPATSFKLADQNGSKSTGTGGASTGGNTSADESALVDDQAISMMQDLNSDAEKLQKKRLDAKKEEDAEDDPG